MLPKSAIKFERYLMDEILSIDADVSEVEFGKKVSVGTDPGANEKGKSLCLADALRAHRGCDRHWIQACHVRPPARRIR